MITINRPASIALTTAVSPTAVPPGEAPLALARVFLWETVEYAPVLAHYLQRAGHPFVCRSLDSLPAPVRNHSRRGRVFELFTLPLDLSAILGSLRRAEVERELELILDLADLPLLMIARKKRPIDPLHPERELRVILDLLPTWRPDRSAGIALPAPMTAAPAQARSQKRSLLAPSTLRMDDGDAHTLSSSQS